MLDRVRAGLVAELSVPTDAFAATGTTFVSRDGARAVVVVSLEEAAVVIAPPVVLPQLRRCGEEALTDLAALLDALAPHRRRPIGSATLAYTDRVPGRAEVPAEAADPAEVEALRDRCDAAEWDESGLPRMPVRFVVRAPDGQAAALAGYERWGAHLAQLGVVAAPQWRGRGLAFAAAAAAVHAAIAEGLVAQWRCRVDNQASARLAARLGFVVHGRQLAVALEDAT